MIDYLYIKNDRGEIEKTILRTNPIKSNRKKKVKKEN